MNRVRSADSGGNKRGRRASFGSVRRLPSGSFQARYTGPDGGFYRAPVTFQTRGDAEAWLALRRSDILRSAWLPENTERTRHDQLTFAGYADDWLQHRQLKARTRAHYRTLLDHHLYPAFGDVSIASISRADVRAWYTELGPERPTLRSHAYGLMRTIMSSAVSDEIVPANPVHIRGAGNVKRVKRIRPATLDELTVLVEALPPRYRVMVLLGAWCALRFGELTELRRDDVDLLDGVIRVRRAVVRVGGQLIVDTPKSAAGIRDVAVPPHLIPILGDHLDRHVGPGTDALLFPGGDGLRHMAPSTLTRVFYPARDRAGRPDLRFHDLRHTGAVLAASTGATLAELMARLGHSTPGAALRYQHAAAERDREIAGALSELAAMRQRARPVTESDQIVVLGSIATTEDRDDGAPALPGAPR